MLPKGTTAPLGFAGVAGLAAEAAGVAGLAVGVVGVAAGEAATASSWAAAREAGLDAGPSPTPGRVIEVALALAPEAKWRFS